jgi:transcriptional regulator with XRE-family HTH domain
MSQKTFGEYLRDLRRQKYYEDGGNEIQMSRKELARRSGISVNVIRNIEQDKVKDVSPHLKALSNALELDELEKTAFYLMANQPYKSESKVRDKEFLEKLFKPLEYPVSIKTAVWDFIAFNSYHYLLWRYTTKNIALMKTGVLGSNLLRVHFNDKFLHEPYDEDELHNKRLRSVQLFRSAPATSVITWIGSVYTPRTPKKLHAHPDFP